MEKRMLLWLLQAREGLPAGDDPWEPWYDKAFGFVVRADTEQDARRLAHEQAGNENRGTFLKRPISQTTEPWLDAKYSICEPLTTDGVSEVVLRDFNAA